MYVVLSIVKSALENGLYISLITLALFLSYLMLNVCDLSTDGCFTFGAIVGLTVAGLTPETAPQWMSFLFPGIIPFLPYIAILAAMLAGMLSGFVVSILQTKLGVNSLLAGIIVNTGLYSLNMLVMQGASIISMPKDNPTVFSQARTLFKGTPLASYSNIIVLLVFVALVILFQWLFLRTRFGLAIRATGNNPEMVKSSSINPVVTTVVGLCIANSFTALSGCLFGQLNTSSDVNVGTGMVTVALASLLIGNAFLGKCRISIRLIGMVLGSFVFYLVYSIALKFDIPAYMLKFVSAVIVLIAITTPYLTSKCFKNGGQKHA